MLVSGVVVFLVVITSAPIGLCCVCTQPLNPQFLCVDVECESRNDLVHHFCYSNFVIKVIVISDRLYSAIPGSFNTKTGYRFRLVHVYKNSKHLDRALSSNIIWTSQDSCGVNLKKGRLYIISGSVDTDGTTARTSNCDLIKPVVDLTVDDINFFGYQLKHINCSYVDQIETKPIKAVNNVTDVGDDDKEDKDKLEKEKENKQVEYATTPPVTTSRPVIPDKNCYCGPSLPTLAPGLSAINIGIGAANNNGENGWHNIDGGFNLAIASGNGNSGQGIGSVSPSSGCVVSGTGTANGNGGVIIGIMSGNNNGGHGWNVGNGGTVVLSGDTQDDKGIGGHNIGSNSGNGMGGTNIGIGSGNGNGMNGWNVGNGGNNAEDNTYNSQVIIGPTNSNGDKRGSKSGKVGHGLGHGGNNVADSSGNGNGGELWAVWSGNGNAVNGWNLGNGGNNAGDNVGNGVMFVVGDSGELVAHESGFGGNNRRNNTGNGKAGEHHVLESGQHNGFSDWNTGNGGNNVGDQSGNGIVGLRPIPTKRRSPGRRPGGWTSGMGNGGNNIGNGSGNGIGGKVRSNEALDSVIGFPMAIDNKIIADSGKGSDKDFGDSDQRLMDGDSDDHFSHVMVLMDEIQNENNAIFKESLNGTANDNDSKVEVKSHV